MIEENVLEETNTEDRLVKEPKTAKVRVYKRRWFILFLYVLYAAPSCVQWIQYSIITNIVTKYYNVSTLAVDWTSLICLISYPPLLLPGTYIIDKMGLRFAALYGIFGTTIGTWMKVFSVDPNLFWLTFLGQSVVFFSQMVILSLPPRLASVWFPENEVSRACSIGVFGIQMGNAIGFIMPPMIVKNHDNIMDIGKDLSYLFYSVAIPTTPIALLVFLFFKSEPPSPPSMAQVKLRKQKQEFSFKLFFRSYKALLTNKPFIYAMISYGLNLGVYNGVCTMLNQFMLVHFPDSEEDAGRIGLFMVVLGMFGSIFFGYILDKTRKYKEVSLGIYSMCLLGLVGFMYALDAKSKLFVYVTGLFLGFFQNSYYPVGYELGAELTFPEPESTSSGILSSMAQSFGTVCILILGYTYGKIGVFWSLGIMAVFLTLGLVITAKLPMELKRQKAFLA